eukprot:TRINITY_DN101_c0_g2_i1.p1 TRINITY_DN101_c0_g2~~TRINITY_DN101_c0_g2_i1.p1  ORF type:complete len:337 (-),score=163.42 TRINITY_DN101_c0_g2_i1:93-1103(-)
MAKGKKGKKGKGKKKDDKPVAGVVNPKSDEVTPDKSRPGAVEDYYDIKGELGRGGMSIVREGIDKASGLRWAVKDIDKSIVDDLAVLQREIDIMKKLSHPNVLQLREVFETDTKICLVTELVSGGELFEKIVEVGSYTEPDAANIVRQVVEGVAYLHANGVAHRDLKPENLLVGGENEDEIKIADFGLSKSFGGGPEARLETSCGTPDYVAPEVLRGEVYDHSVDLWSVGVITYILLCGFPPFWGESQGELFDKILSVSFDFPDPEWTNVSQEAKDFIQHLLVKDPAERFTAKECCDHAWIKMSKNAGGAGGKQLRSLESVRNLAEYQAKRKNAGE